MGKILLVGIIILLMWMVIGVKGCWKRSDIEDAKTRTLTDADRLVWDESRSAGVLGYKVYGWDRHDSDNTRVWDVKKDTEIYLKDIRQDIESGIWCFAVTAYDHKGHESAYSNDPDAICGSIK